MLFTLTYSLNLTCQVENDSLELQSFWKSHIHPIINGEKKVVENYTHFPLEGDWGYMIELEKSDDEWKKEDFIRNYENLFTQEVIDSLKLLNYKDIEILSHEDGGMELLVSVNFIKWIDDFKDEYGIIFRFKVIENSWKLYLIQGVG